MMDKNLADLDDKELKIFWRTCHQNGAGLLTAAKRMICDYAENGYRLPDSIKTGIYAYHYDYAKQAIERLVNVPDEQKVLGNELKDIQVSTEFVQSMAPEMSEWERLHYFQYGTEIRDLSGKSVENIKGTIGSMYLIAWTGLLYQKFKEQAKFFERLFSSPMLIPMFGPVMVYRKWKERGYYYYYFNPDNVAARERE